MGWHHVKIRDDDRGNVVIRLQEAFIAAYHAHLAAGRGLLRGAGIFQRHKMADRTVDLYFSPEMTELLLPIVKQLGAAPCEAPRHDPSTHRWEGLGMLTGEAYAWDLIEGNPKD